MKNFTLTIGIAATALLTLPTLSLAADEKPERKRPEGAAGGGRFTPEERIKRMTETLALTEDQQTKVKAIFEKNAPAMKELMAKGRENLTDEDKTKMRELFKTQTEEISAILTPEQKEKQKAEMEKRRGEGGPRRGGDKPGEKKPEAK